MQRLAIVDPALVAAIDALPDDADRRGRAREAVVEVLGKCGLLDDEVVAAVLAGKPDLDPLSELVRQFDSDAWRLREEEEGVNLYAAAFQRARAAAALREFAAGSADGDLAGVLYEVYYATGDLSYVRALAGVAADV